MSLPPMHCHDFMVFFCVVLMCVCDVFGLVLHFTWICDGQYSFPLIVVLSFNSFYPPPVLSLLFLSPRCITCVCIPNAPHALQVRADHVDISAISPSFGSLGLQHQNCLLLCVRVISFTSPLPSLARPLPSCAAVCNTCASCLWSQLPCQLVVFLSFSHPFVGVVCCVDVFIYLFVDVVVLNGRVRVSLGSERDVV